MLTLRTAFSLCKRQMSAVQIVPQYFYKRLTTRFTVGFKHESVDFKSCFLFKVCDFMPNFIKLELDSLEGNIS